MWGQALKDLLKLWSYIAHQCPIPLKQCHKQSVFLLAYTNSKVCTLRFQQNWFGFCPAWGKTVLLQAHTVHRVKECSDLVAALSQHAEQGNSCEGKMGITITSWLTGTELQMLSCCAPLLSPLPWAVNALKCSEATFPISAVLPSLSCQMEPGRSSYSVLLWSF